MKRNVSHRDWEALSAYVDGQLTPVEQTRLQERLRKQPELQEALADVQCTRSMLRALPRLRSPRNFTLKPGQVAAARPVASNRLSPFFGMASALATLFLVILMVGEGLMGPATVSPVAMDAPVAKEMAVEAPPAPVPNPMVEATLEVQVVELAPDDAVTADAQNAAVEEANQRAAEPSGDAASPSGTSLPAEGAAEPEASASSAEPLPTPTPEEEISAAGAEFALPEADVTEAQTMTLATFDVMTETNVISMAERIGEPEVMSQTVELVAEAAPLSEQVEKVGGEAPAAAPTEVPAMGGIGGGVAEMAPQVGETTTLQEQFRPEPGWTPVDWIKLTLGLLAALMAVLAVILYRRGS